MILALELAHQAPTNNETIGINVAVDDLIRAWFRYGTASQFICRPETMGAYDHFMGLAKAAGVEDRCVGLDPRTPQHNLEDIDCLFRPDPQLADMAWRRQQLKTPYAACGIVHGLSGEQVAHVLNDLVLAPTTNADALICPSTAARDAVLRLWESYADYLQRRGCGGSFTCPVQTPVIPLGIDTEKFASKRTAEKRAAQRTALTIAEDEIVILFVGRLSFATKAHPLPLMQAAEQAAKATKRKLRLIFNGYFKPATMEPQFRDLAKDFCQNVICDFVMHDDPRFPEGLWACADIFVSLADNIQESFGLTPIEAMACGLPVIASDWDGYRDGIRHGEDGFLIPTYTPPASAGGAIATHYFNERNYGAYLVAAAQSTMIDVAATTAALVTLVENDAMREAMGKSGQQRAQSHYDWRVIIPTYENLWKELGEKRQRQKMEPVFYPDYPNPFAMFGGFPTASLSETGRIRIVMTSTEIAAILKHDMNVFISELLMPKPVLVNFIEVVRGLGSPALDEILSVVPIENHPVFWRSIGWMMKHGICSYEAP